MIAANAMFKVLVDEKTVQKLYDENKSLFDKVRDTIERFIAEIKEIIRQLGKKWDEVEALCDDRETLENIRAMFDSVMWKTEQNSKNTATQDGEVKYNIKKGMSDEERLYELKKYKLMPVPVDYEKLNGVNLEDIANAYKRNATKILTDLAKKFGVFKKYSNADIQLEFFYGSKRLRKSLHSQDNNYDGFAKMLSCFDKLVESAIPIEIHGEKQQNRDKIDNTLKNVYVLISAIMDNDGIIPVQFEIKEFFAAENVLYLSIALNKTEANVYGLTPTVNGDDNGPRLTSEYSIADILSKINPKDENLLKYVPDGLLDDERKQAKQHALEKDAKKYGIFKENGENNSPKKSLKSRDDEYIDVDKPDIRYSMQKDFQEAFFGREESELWKIVDNKAMERQYEYGEQIHVLLETDDNSKNQKLVILTAALDSDFTIKSVYLLENSDYNVHGENPVVETITRLEEVEHSNDYNSTSVPVDDTKAFIRKYKGENNTSSYSMEKT